MEYKEDSIAPHIQARFQILEKIGSGAYGHVWRVKEKKNKKFFALKKVFLAFQNDVDSQRTFRQISILKQINHPNIIKLEEVIRAENQLDLYLVFEYLQCDLFNAIKNNVLNEMHKKYVVFQLAKALVYLHSAGILHRDLKPSNILIDSACRIKICDFGLSRTLFHYDGEPPVMTQFIATRWYRAPEVLFGSINYSYKSDMWSLGCLIYEIYASKSLLPGSDSTNQIEKLLQFKGFPNDKECADLNVNKLDVLLSHFKTERRPENHYFKSNWSSALISLMKGLLEYSPVNRWGPHQVLSSEHLEQFENFEDIITAPKQISLRTNDNKKHEKQFYRNFIYKIFVSKSNIILPHELSKSESQSQSKRNLCTSMRKKPGQSLSTSLHYSLNKKQVKSVSKTLHVSARVTNEKRTARKSQKISRERSQNQWQSSPYNSRIRWPERLWRNSSKLKTNSPYKLKLEQYSIGKSKGLKKRQEDRTLKQISLNASSMKSSLHQEAKKQIKRKVMAYI